MEEWRNLQRRRERGERKFARMLLPNVASHLAKVGENHPARVVANQVLERSARNPATGVGVVHQVASHLEGKEDHLVGEDLEKMSDQAMEEEDHLAVALAVEKDHLIVAQGEDHLEEEVREDRPEAEDSVDHLVAVHEDLVEDHLLDLNEVVGVVDQRSRATPSGRFTQERNPASSSALSRTAPISEGSCAT